MRFAVATAGSLIFPFGPHHGPEMKHQMTRPRVWEEPGPEADPALRQARHPVRLPGRKRRPELVPRPVRPVLRPGECSTDDSSGA